MLLPFLHKIHDVSFFYLLTYFSHKYILIEFTEVSVFVCTVKLQSAVMLGGAYNREL